MAETIIEELLLHGQTTQNRLVELTLEKLTQNTDGIYIQLALIFPVFVWQKVVFVCQRFTFRGGVTEDEARIHEFLLILILPRSCESCILWCCVCLIYLF